MIEQFRNCIEHFKLLILDELDAECWIAGGALRDYFSGSIRKGDIDIFFPNNEELNKVKTYFDEKKAELYFENEMVYKYKYNNKTYDLVRLFFSSANETINHFDFTVSCCAVDKENVYYNETYFIDLAKRRLVINNLPYPVSTLRRLQKYIKNGYSICNGGILKLAEAISQIKIKSDNLDTKLYID